MIFILFSTIQRAFLFLKQHTNSVIHLPAAASFARGIHQRQGTARNTDAVISSSYLSLWYLSLQHLILKGVISVRYIYYHLCLAETR